MASTTTSTSKKAKSGRTSLPKTGREASGKPKSRGRAKAEVLTETKVPSNAEATLEDVVPATAEDELELLPDVAADADSEEFGPDVVIDEPGEAASEDDMRMDDVDEVVARKVSKDDEAQSFLAMYFKNMAELDVLRPEQEFESAREIEALEIELWTMVLGYLPGAGHVANVVERTIGKPFEPFEEYRTLAAKVLKAKGASPNRKKLDTLIDEMAGKLRELDIDRLFVDAATAEVRRALRGVAGDSAPGFDTNVAAFREFGNAVVAKTVAIKSAKNAFVRANLRLVVSIARRFNHGRLPLADLIQEGNIGLMKAVERYDYRRGFRFSTYASWWIRHAISRALADKGRAVRLPVHMIDAYHRIAKSERELQTKLERPASNEELSEATGIEADKLEKMRSFLNETPVSLDRPISDEDGRKLIDILVSDEDGPSAPEQIILGETHHEMLKLLQSLKPIEADILRKRFGLANDKERTLKEIGDEYHLSRERVRQLQEQALGKMRKAMQKINAA